jgi:hypothetical protein
MENTANRLVLSRSVCYAMLAVLAVALLFQASAATGVNVWSAAEMARDSGDGLHFAPLLATARISGSALREELHNTWLFLYVFAVVWAIVLLWSLLERRRLHLEMSRREAAWMGWMTFAVAVAAIAYGAGTNGVFARQYALAAPITDVLALAFVLALPVFAWKRMQRGKGLSQEDSDGRRAIYTTLHLNNYDPNDDDSLTRSRARFEETEPGQPSEGMTLQTLRIPTPDAAAVAAMDRLLESTMQAVARQPEAVTVTKESFTVISTPMIAAQAPEISSPAAEPAAVTEAAPAPLLAAQTAKDFREQLKALNESWARIESAGQEIEQWFDAQRQQVIAHLQMHPRGRGAEMALAPPTDFLRDRLAAVDTEWAAIRRSTLEIARWFGDVPGAKE